MEQNPSCEASNHSASQIPRLFGTWKFNYHVHRVPPLFPILSYVNLFHILPTFSFKIHSNFILTFTPKFPASSLHDFRPKFCKHFSLSPPLYITLEMFDEAYKIWSSWLCSNHEHKCPEFWICECVYKNYYSYQLYKHVMSIYIKLTYLLTPWYKIFFEKLTVTELVKP
jgi:hypothetical protein